MVTYEQGSHIRLLTWMDEDVEKTRCWVFSWNDTFRLIQEKEGESKEIFRGKILDCQEFLRANNFPVKIILCLPYNEIKLEKAKE